MNVQPKLSNNHACMMTAPALTPRDLAPASVLGLPDGRILALGDVP